MYINNIIEKTSRKVKAAFGLAIAEMVVDELKSDEQGYRLAKEALELSWQWIEKENISGTILAEYVDSPTNKDLGIREEYYNDNEVMIAALVVLTIAIGLVARFAYELVGDKTMSTPIWETNEKSLYELVNFASKTTLYNQEKVDNLTEILINNYGASKHNKIEKSILLSLGF